jgi:hypothetical protein
MSASAPNAAENRSQPESSSMNEADLTNAAWWASCWGEVEHWAFLGVILALGIEFAALKFAAPFKENLDRARQDRLAELSTQAKEAERQIAEAQARQKEAEERTEQLRAVIAANEMPRGRIDDDTEKHFSMHCAIFQAALYKSYMTPPRLMASSWRYL